MDTKLYNILKHVGRILIINALLVAVTFCTRGLFSSNDWTIGVDVEYQYENEPDTTYSIHYDQRFSYNTRVKWIEPYFSTPAGYTNRLVVMCSIKSNRNITPRYFGTKELMYVPDRKFQVKNISFVKGQMTTYRPFLKNLP